MNCSKSLRLLGLRPRPRGGAYDAPPDPLVARGFLPSAIAASRLRRLQFPHGLKSNSIKERCPMRLGGNMRQRSWGDRRIQSVLPVITHGVYTDTFSQEKKVTVYSVKCLVCGKCLKSKCRVWVNV